MIRDVLLRVATADLQSIHTALGREFAPGQKRDFLFSPAPLPGGHFGAWVRIIGENETRGREVIVPANGEESDFLLRAFAAGKRKDGKKRAFPVAPEFDNARNKWLARQAEAHGFSIVRANFTVENNAVRRPSATFGFNVAVFAGRLKVTDADKFESALRNGIGTRRGYGCGMLILFPDDRAKNTADKNNKTRRTR